jgi:hypothetical protein
MFWSYATSNSCFGVCRDRVPRFGAEFVPRLSTASRLLGVVRADPEEMCSFRTCDLLSGVETSPYRGTWWPWLYFDGLD